MISPGQKETVWYGKKEKVVVRDGANGNFFYKWLFEALYLEEIL